MGISRPSNGPTSAHPIYMYSVIFLIVQGTFRPEIQYESLKSMVQCFIQNFLNTTKELFFPVRNSSSILVEIVKISRNGIQFFPSWSPNSWCMSWKSLKQKTRGLCFGSMQPPITARPGIALVGIYFFHSHLAAFAPDCWILSKFHLRFGQRAEKGASIVWQKPFRVSSGALNS